MSEQPPKHRSPTLADLAAQIDALRDGHLSLNERLDDQAEELRDNTRATKRMDEELRENTRATKRIDDKTARMIELFEDAGGFFRTVGRIAEWGKKLAWLTVPWAFIAGGIRAGWKWLSGGVGS